MPASRRTPLCLRHCLWAAALAAALPAALAADQGALAEYLAQKHGTVAFHAVRLADGEVLASRDAHVPMIPASVQKLCTSAAALEVLGSAFEFTTSLWLLGEDLAVVGDGDPLFGDPVLAAAGGGTIYDVFDRWAAALAERGVSRISGDLVLDESIFLGGRHADWPAGQYQRWYCAPVGGLNFNDNCLDVRLTLGPDGIAAEVEPASRYLLVLNRVRIGRRQLWRLGLSPDEATVTLTGTVEKSMTEPLSVAVDSPALLFGRVLADRLAAAGIALEGTVRPGRVVDPQHRPDALAIAEHRTGIWTVVAAMHKRSLNLAAECLSLRAAAAGAEERTVGFADAARTVQGMLTGHYCLDPAELAVADGSGLSRGNRLSAAAAVELLSGLARGPRSRPFGESLSFAGLDGTLRRRLADLAGRVAAKTGHLAGVSAVAGYLLDAGGRPAAAFAIFCNGTRGGNWRANDLQDKLLRDWLRRLESTPRSDLNGDPACGDPASDPASGDPASDPAGDDPAGAGFSGSNDSAGAP